MHGRSIQMYFDVLPRLHLLRANDEPQCYSLALKLYFKYYLPNATIWKIPKR